MTAFLGFVAGQLVPEFLSRRALARSRYDAAIAAVSKAASTRHGVGVRVPPEYLRATSGAEHASVEAELSKAGVERFVREDAEARAALAVLSTTTLSKRRTLRPVSLSVIRSARSAFTRR